MSNYTVTIREYIESLSDGSQPTTADIIENGRPKLFDFDYPLFDATYKKTFETDFIRHFYFREIGQETLGRFKFHLETWMNINMPYWNKMFESELIVFDPMKNASRTTTSTKVVTGTATEDNFDRELISNNPDERLALTANDGQGVIEYASGITENNQNNSQTSNGTETLNYTTDGKIGVQTYSKMLAEYRTVLLRIEASIFKELEQLFMLVY